MSAIKAGDLVMVVHQCHPNARGIGRIFRVALTKERTYFGRCKYCHGDHSGLYAKAEHPFGDTHTGAPVAWLIKIDPPALPESIETREEIHA